MAPEDLVRSEAVANIFQQVVLAHHGVDAIVHGPGPSDLRPALQTQPQAFLQQRHVFNGDHAWPASPDRVDERKSDQVVPLLTQIVDMAKAAVDVQAEIADDERAACADHRIYDLIVRHLDEVGMKPALPGQQAQQHLRGARGSVERDGSHLLPRHLTHQHDRAHRAAAGNGNAGHHA